MFMLTKNISSIENNVFLRIIAELIYLWNDNFNENTENSVLLSNEEGIRFIRERLLYHGDGEFRNMFGFLFALLFRILLAKKQYHTAYNYFQQEEWQLKDRFKPLYYATLHFLQDEHPTDYLRMGPELRETVDDLLAEVAQMAIDYA